MNHYSTIPEKGSSVRGIVMLWVACCLFCCPQELAATGSGPQDPASQSGSLSLAFAGDIMVHDQNYEHRPFSRMYDGVRPLLGSSDLVFGNLEFPVVEERPFAGYPLFNAHVDYVQAAIDAGFTVFSLANNHSADQVKAGVLSTQAAMEQIARQNADAGRQIWFNGLRIPDAAAQVLTAPLYRLEVIEKKGWRIGFVSVTEFLNLPGYAKYVQLMNWRDADRLKVFADWIREQRSQVDFLVLGIHWGTEYAIRPDKTQPEAVKTLVEAGVDLLWGHHPHVLQPWYTLDSPRGKAVVLPSLGNFVSAQAWYLNPAMGNDRRAYKGDSAVFRLRLEKSEAGVLVAGQTEPVLIAHRRMPEGNIQVFPYRELLHLEDEAWSKYFRLRFQLLSRFFPGSRESSLFFDGRTDERLRSLPEYLWQETEYL